jgi:hypothetical protein
MRLLLHCLLTISWAAPIGIFLGIVTIWLLTAAH